MAENLGKSSKSSNQGTSGGRSINFPSFDFMSKNRNQTESTQKRRHLKLDFQDQLLSPSSSSTFLNFNQPEPIVNQQTSVTRPKFPLPMGKISTKTMTTNFLPSDKFNICQSMKNHGVLKINQDSEFEFTSEDLRDFGEIGRGGFGTVNKMEHKKSKTVMAVKRIRSAVDEKEQKQLLMDLNVVMESNECPFIVQFYGAMFYEGDCWICMELMDTSLDKFYKFVYELLEERIPESILGKIAVATVKALNYLKEKLHIIHRDVKPSNILLDRRGNIKLCDFGISGHLIDSMARTRDAGCRPYMAPERIDIQRAKGCYDVRSDVWSFGLTLIEVATGEFPYPKTDTVFEQLCQVIDGKAPRLSSEYKGMKFSHDIVTFVNTCLLKDETRRPKYKELLQHPFIVKSKIETTDVAAYIDYVLNKMTSVGVTFFTANQP